MRREELDHGLAIELRRVAAADVIVHRLQRFCEVGDDDGILGSIELDDEVLGLVAFESIDGVEQAEDVEGALIEAVDVVGGLQRAARVGLAARLHAQQAQFNEGFGPVRRCARRTGEIVMGRIVLPARRKDLSYFVEVRRGLRRDGEGALLERSSRRFVAHAQPCACKKAHGLERFGLGCQGFLGLVRSIRETALDDSAVSEQNH